MRIEKVSETTPIQAQVVNEQSNSTTDTYSCDYINDVGKEVYSTEEQVIGTWLGKPLYRKVIDLGNLPNNSSKTVTYDTTNIDYCITVKGMAKRATDNSYFPLPYSAPSTGSGITLALLSNGIYIQTMTDRSAFVGIAILEYTKTTD